MNYIIPFLAAAIMFAVGAINFARRNDPKPIIDKPPQGPKSGDMRIVAATPSGFIIEYYYPYPGWRHFAPTGAFDTKEQAMSLIERVNKSTESKIIETVPNPKP